ncbi:MAG: PIN domain-containing protein [Lutibacter sp.]|nr:PIN domain-containing protein [Lutibacter sp.]
MKGIESVVLDSSFCIRLLKADADFHQNAVDYFEYFLENGIEMYLSTIVVSEYAVGDNPDNLLSLKVFRLLEFDYADAKIAGEFLATLRNLGNFGDFGDRKVVINDIKLFAQIQNRKIDAFMTKDRKSLVKMIEPLWESHNLKFEFIDLSIPLNDKLGRLF